MKRQHPLLFLLPIALGLIPACTPNTQLTHAVMLQDIIDSVYFNHPETRGILLHIEAPDQGISWSGAVGWADSATKRKLTPEDPVLIASITKMYMSATTLRLIEKRKLSLESRIDTLLSPATDSLLRSGGYRTDSILIKHLLSCTSGLFDYVESTTFLDRSVKQPGYIWTRKEQMRLAIAEGHPYGNPGKNYHHSDMNFLVLAEVFESVCNKPYYQVVRDELQFEKHGLSQTWWNLQEEPPAGIPALAHQFATGYKVDNYTQHGSYDNFGGGGIVSTAKDLTRFTQLLFNGTLFRDPATLPLIYTEIKTQDPTPSDYLMGLMRWKNNGNLRYGHGGFWGTMVQYLPELNATVTVFVMERDEWPRTIETIDAVERVLRRE